MPATRKTPARGTRARRAYATVAARVATAQQFVSLSGRCCMFGDWALGLGLRLTFAIEGTGSYGAGLTSAVRRRGVGAVEMIRQIKVAKDVAVKGRDDAHRTVRRATSRTGDHRVGRDQCTPCARSRDADCSSTPRSQNSRRSSAS